MQNLAKLRNRSSLKQSEIAEKIGISRQAYCHYETGKREPDFSTLCKLADYFNTSVDFLLGRTEEKTSPIQWTEEEKALGVVTEYKEKLSPDEREMLDLYRAVRDEKGEKSAQAIRTLTRTYLEGK